MTSITAEYTVCHAQDVRDALDEIDKTPFGNVGRLLDKMADDAQRAVNERNHLIAAGRMALNFIENTEAELGIKLESGDALREAISQATEVWA
jgi:hypothetical protein